MGNGGSGGPGKRKSKKVQNQKSSMKYRVNLRSTKKEEYL